MKIEGWLFNGLTIFFLPITVIYGLWTGLEEPIGFYALLVTTLMSGMVGGYLVLTGRKIDPRPEDNPDGEIRELAGDQGFYSPHSWWPLPLALSAAMLFFGMAVGWWVMLIGAALGVVSLVGIVFEYYTGDHAH